MPTEQCPQTTWPAADVRRSWQMRQSRSRGGGTQSRQPEPRQRRQVAAGAGVEPLSISVSFAWGGKRRACQPPPRWDGRLGLTARQRGILRAPPDRAGGRAINGGGFSPPPPAQNERPAGRAPVRCGATPATLRALRSRLWRSTPTGSMEVRAALPRRVQWRQTRQAPRGQRWSVSDYRPDPKKQRLPGW